MLKLAIAVTGILSNHIKKAIMSYLNRIHCLKISHYLIFLNYVSVTYRENDNGMDMSDKHPIKTPQELKKNRKKLSETLFKFTVRFHPLLYK